MLQDNATGRQMYYDNSFDDVGLASMIWECCTEIFHNSFTHAYGSYSQSDVVNQKDDYG
jgi:hypothetical protein